MNFQTDHFVDNLNKAGFDKSQKTMFIWEGVTYYLPASVIDATLRLIKSCSPPGSSISFDYASYSPEVLNQESIRKLRQTMNSRYAGEPVSFSMNDGQVEEYLSARAYEIIDHLTAEEMKEKYLNFPGAPCGDIPGLFCLVHASHCDS